MNELKVQVLEGGYTPTRAHGTDAGLDLYAAAGEVFYGTPIGMTMRVPLGVKVAIPDGHVGLLLPRSSLLLKKGVVGMTGVIDAGYRGELIALMHASASRGAVVERGDKIYQLVVLPIATPTVVEVDELEETPRGEDGFGSTGLDYLDDIHRKETK